MYLKRTTYVGYVALQLFCGYNSYLHEMVRPIKNNMFFHVIWVE